MYTVIKECGTVTNGLKQETDPYLMTTFHQEVSAGERFEFGANWRAFLNTLDEERILEAELSLKSLFQIETFEGLRFLDLGSGSGLFSLAAKRLGAQVHSFDYDPNSVGCTRHLQQTYFPNDPNWTVQQGSALDVEYLASLGTFDIVYSWGVLHHTGAMWQALQNTVSLVAPGGHLCVALYNDEGRISKRWTRVKRIYNANGLGKALVWLAYVPAFFAKAVVRSLARRRNIFAQYKRERGMSMYYDWIDWLGGYPFEVTNVEQVFHFYRQQGFEMTNLITRIGKGCNEFVFQKQALD